MPCEGIPGLSSLDSLADQCLICPIPLLTCLLIHPPNTYQRLHRPAPQSADGNRKAVRPVVGTLQRHGSAGLVSRGQDGTGQELGADLEGGLVCSLAGLGGRDDACVSGPALLFKGKRVSSPPEPARGVTKTQGAPTSRKLLWEKTSGSASCPQSPQQCPGSLPTRIVCIYSGKWPVG